MKEFIGSVRGVFAKVRAFAWRGWCKGVLITLFVIFLLKTGVADWNWVPSGSMKPTILEGDLVFVNKLAFGFKVPFTPWHLAHWSEPQHNDIVVFFSPRDGTRLVKRVIGCPGDVVEMRNNILYLNGKKLDYKRSETNPFLKELHEAPDAILATEKNGDSGHWVLAYPSQPARRSFAKTTVPAGKYFVLGDARDNSFDSRYFGLVDRDQVVGRASRVVFSFDKNHSYNPRFSRFFASL